MTSYPSHFSAKDTYWLKRALELAERAERLGEVPVGALITLKDEIIGEGFNNPIADHDPTAHAEIVAMRAAGQSLKNYRLVGATLYVTLEPCVMCMGAMSHARIERVVYGAPDRKRGAAGSALKLQDADFLNHRIEVHGGLLEMECGHQLRRFFREKR